MITFTPLNSSPRRRASPLAAGTVGTASPMATRSPLASAPAGKSAYELAVERFQYLLANRQEQAARATAK